MVKQPYITPEKLAAAISNFCTAENLKGTWDLLCTESYKKKRGVWEKLCMTLAKKKSTIFKYQSRAYWVLRRKKNIVKDILFPISNHVPNIQGNECCDTEEKIIGNENNYRNDEKLCKADGDEVQWPIFTGNFSEPPTNTTFKSPPVTEDYLDRGKNNGSKNEANGSERVKKESDEYVESGGNIIENGNNDEVQEYSSAEVKNEETSQGNIPPDHSSSKSDLIFTNIQYIGNHKIPEGSVIIVKVPKNAEPLNMEKGYLEYSTIKKKKGKPETEKEGNGIRSIITVPRIFWEKYWRNSVKLKPRDSTGDWHDDFQIIFNKYFPICSLAFEDHKCNPCPARSTTAYFACYAHCQHTTCTKFQFHVYEEISAPHNDKSCIVTRFSDIFHKGERHRRPIRQWRREELQQQLAGVSPFVLETNMNKNE